MYQTLETRLEKGIFMITINRPEKMNALNKDVMQDLGKVMEEIESDELIKGVILTGAGQ